MNLGHTIQRLRKSRGMHQEELANLSGISATYLSLIENDRKEPNLTTLKAISDQLEVPLPILFFLALDKSDIPPKKRDAFELISPALYSYIGTLFGEH